MMANETDQAIERLNTPGEVLEVDPKTAEELGAFEEDALSEEEALESAQE
jgi:ABC-type uncharacterized transport system auxiliary subunit